MNLSLYLNGAFFSESAFESSRLLSSDYEAAQRDVCDALADAGCDGWDYDHAIRDPDRLRFDIRSKYPTLIPVSFASKSGEQLTDRVAELVAKCAPDADGIDVELGKVDIDFFDFGVGVIGLVLRLGSQPSTSLQDIRALAEELSTRLAPDLNPVVDEAASEFHRAAKKKLPEAVVQSSWLQEDGVLVRSEDREHALGRSAPGRLLWLHRTYVFPPADRAVEAHLEELLPNLFERDESADLCFLAGLGSSAIAARTTAAYEGTTLKDVKSLLTLMDLQWAYIAAAMEIDRTLFRRLNDFRAQAGDAEPDELEEESRLVLQLYDRVRLFNATINSMLIDLGGGTRRSWDLMANVQSIPELSATIDDKLSALRNACDTMIGEASIRRQRRIAFIVELFTGFSVVASAAGVAAFFFATDLDASSTVRVVVLILAAMVVVLALGLARAVRDKVHDR